MTPRPLMRLVKLTSRSNPEYVYFADQDALVDRWPSQYAQSAIFFEKGQRPTPIQWLEIGDFCISFDAKDPSGSIKALVRLASKMPSEDEIQKVDLWNFDWAISIAWDYWNSLGYSDKERWQDLSERYWGQKPPAMSLNGFKSRCSRSLLLLKVKSETDADSER